MKKKWIIPVVCFGIVAASVFPRTGFADYILNAYMAASYEADTLLANIMTGDGMMSDPDLVVTTPVDGDTIAAGDSLNVDLGDISGYWEVYVGYNAHAFVESIDVYFGSSADSGWSTGSTVYFDRNPATLGVDHWSLSDTLAAYGTLVPIQNTYGSFLVGPYGVMTIKNLNTTGDLDSLTVILKKRK